MSLDKPRSVDAYVQSLPDAQAAIVLALRKLIREVAPELNEAFKWSQPVWELSGPVCYAKVFKSYVNFGFWRGAELAATEDPTRELQGGGDKMRHRRLTTLEDLNPKPLAHLIQTAVELNRRHGDPTRVTS